MNTEAQRVAIAEACGWVRIYKGRSNLYGGKPGNHRVFAIPDYLNSLDAMHAAEKVLNAVQEVRYAQAIAEVVKSRHWNHLGFDCLHATATERAEAFLRTLNLWV